MTTNPPPVESKKVRASGCKESRPIRLTLVYSKAQTVFIILVDVSIKLLRTTCALVGRPAKTDCEAGQAHAIYRRKDFSAKVESVCVCVLLTLIAATVLI